MTNDTTLLLGLDGLVAERVTLGEDGRPVVHLATADAEAARCPACQVVSSMPKGWVLTRPRDLRHGGRGVALLWRKRRWRCRERHCPRTSFTERVAAVPARARMTTRLRAEAGAVVGDGARTVVQAGRDLGLSWPTVMMVKLAARNAFGFRNTTNQRLRVRCVTTRRARGHLKPG